MLPKMIKTAWKMLWIAVGGCRSPRTSIREAFEICYGCWSGKRLMGALAVAGGDEPFTAALLSDEPFAEALLSEPTENLGDPVTYYNPVNDERRCGGFSNSAFAAACVTWTH